MFHDPSKGAVPLFSILKRVPLVLIFLILPVVSGNAESLWVNGPSLVEDHKPSAVGDLVTVEVSEKTRARDVAKTDLTKENESSAADGEGILDFIKKLGFSTKSSMTGNGSRERTHDLTTTVTCLVTEILPGGNLRIEGRREIRVQKDMMTLNIEGIVRPLDIDSENVVESDKLAEVVVSVKGIGSISDLQNPGLLTRLFNAIF